MKPILKSIIFLLSGIFFFDPGMSYSANAEIELTSVRTYNTSEQGLMSDDYMENLPDPLTRCIGELSIYSPEIWENNSETIFACHNDEVKFIIDSIYSTEMNYSIFYGDGESEIHIDFNEPYYHTYNVPGNYEILFVIEGKECVDTIEYRIAVIKCFDCEDCIGSFAPEPGKTYVVGAWVKEGASPLSTTTYTKPEIYILFKNIENTYNSYVGPFVAHGQIIDGWQRIEDEFEVPSNADSIFIKLNQNASNSTDVCYFDDLRIFPQSGSVKSYVFDPVTLRLVAELDENNYATYYEYDEEGKLIRVKKETERGIMTIQENRNNSFKTHP
jgi:hypothetical protein